jgi:hypothetical protein
MRLTEFTLTETKSRPCIVVDVQPAYAYYQQRGEPEGSTPKAYIISQKVINFVNQQTGPVLMFINAEETDVSNDTKARVINFWENNGFDPYNWNRVTIVDKGYGFFRAWMDQGVSESIIIRVIRALYQAKANDSRDLDLEQLKQLVGAEWQDWMADDPIIINWTSVAQLKKFNGAYIMGGGRNECLREVELLMNAFNIGYKRIDRLVY